LGHSPYILDGVPIPSVTEVLNVINKPFLYAWYAKHGWKECERIKQESGELGQRVHDAIESYLRGDGYELSGREAEMMQLFLKWKEETDFRPMELEHKVISRNYRFHGTFDALGTFGDSTNLFLLDWKTSSKIDDSYALQLSAYAAAYEEETGICVANGGIVRIDKKPDAKKPFEVKTFNALPKYFDVFLDCLNVWNFVNRKDKWGKAA
jgi:CRISPR/Cas system-associated exonuclease Cas4 (RecB family)